MRCRPLRRNNNRSLLAAVLAAALAIAACERQTAEPPPAPVPPSAQTQDPALDQASVGVWLHGIGILEASLGEARILADAIQTLLDDPDEKKLSAARLAWQRAHDAYNEFELFTSLSESDPRLFASLLEYDFALDAWPIQPGYLDYFDVYTHSGIVNDIAMPLTAEALRQQHGFTDSSDVSLGFHALEYLLWGEKGERPADDYRKAILDEAQRAADMRPVDLPRNRRRALITLLANLLIDDLESFKAAIENPSGLLRSAYLALPPESRLALFQEAGHLLLSRHRDQLQAQLEPESAATAATDNADALVHNQFAGGTPNALAHSLLTVQQVLVESENGFGTWLLDSEEQRATALEQAGQLHTQLLAWEQQAWPPALEQSEALVEALTALAELFAPDTPAPEL